MALAGWAHSRQAALESYSSRPISLALEKAPAKMLANRNHLANLCMTGCSLQVSLDIKQSLPHPLGIVKGQNEEKALWLQQWSAAKPNPLTRFPHSSQSQAPTQEPLDSPVWSSQPTSSRKKQRQMPRRSKCWKGQTSQNLGYRKMLLTLPWKDLLALRVYCFLQTFLDSKTWLIRQPRNLVTNGPKARAACWGVNDMESIA